MTLTETISFRIRFSDHQGDVMFVRINTIEIGEIQITFIIEQSFCWYEKACVSEGGGFLWADFGVKEETAETAVDG